MIPKTQRLLLCLLFCLAHALACAEHFPVLFVLYDAGETHALTPVMKEMRDTKYAVLVMGTAREVLDPQCVHSGTVVDLNSDLGITPCVDKQCWQREAALEKDEITKVSTNLSADTVVTGVVSEVQRQLAAAFKAKGSRVLGYYDNPHVGVDGFALGAVVRRMEPHVDVMMVPSEAIAESFTVKTAVVGQPTLGDWQHKITQIDRAAIRRGLCLSRDPLLVFCGGYGGNYPEAFELLAMGLKELTGWQVVVQLHPKVSGDFERSMLNKHGLEKVRVVQKCPGTIALVAAADVVAVHQSTVGVQALFAGKKVVHVDTPESSFSNFAIDAGITPRITKAADLPVVLHTLRQQATLPSNTLYERAGIPKDAVEHVRAVIGGMDRMDSKDPKDKIIPLSDTVFRSTKSWTRWTKWTGWTRWTNCYPNMGAIDV